MQWTQVHQPFIHSTANKLLIQAFAGTGNTTTLLGYAIHYVSVKILYLSCNKSVELAAKGDFPRKVRLQNRTMIWPILPERLSPRTGDWYATCSVR